MNRFEAPSAEAHQYIPQTASGDSIIENPDAEWDTTVGVPLSPGEVWRGRFGILRMGPVDEGGAGIPFPPRFDKYLIGSKLRALRSLPDDAPEPRLLQVGDSVPDGHKDDRAVVVEIDEENRTMVLDMRWTSDKDGDEPLHYTWQLTVEDGDTPDTAKLNARTRMENVKHPAAWNKLGPKADEVAMRLIAEGMAPNDEAFRAEAQRRKRNRTIAAGIAIGAAAGWKAYKATSKKS